MKLKLIVLASVSLVLTACESPTMGSHETALQGEEEIASCIRTIMALDEGRWAYMGTIARLNGTFRTYEAFSIHAPAGSDRWVGRSFGGDVGGTEETAEPQFQRLIGTSLVPEEDGELVTSSAIKFNSCKGPDQEGRYEAELEYTLASRSGGTEYVDNVSWYSEHGSYFAEDIRNEDGRVVARRSGVNTPIE